MSLGIEIDKFWLGCYMKESVWNALDNLDETITKLLALRDVLSIHPLSRDVMVEILDSFVNEFSEKHRIVFDEVRTLCYETQQSDCISGENVND
jgi:hypothetical protein